MAEPTGDPATATEAAARLLRADILAGILPPATPLRLRMLADRYSIGATPLREALSRLAAQGVVVSEGQRGFSVPPVTRAHLIDITQSRQLVEPEALRLAMQHGDAAWEDEIVASFHLLKRELERRVSASEAFCDALYEQKTRYRRVLKSVGLLAGRAGTAYRHHGGSGAQGLRRRPRLTGGEVAPIFRPQDPRRTPCSMPPRSCR